MTDPQSSKERIKAFLKRLEGGCSGCDFDEAEGGLMNHCDDCCRWITTEAFDLLVIRMGTVTYEIASKPAPAAPLKAGDRIVWRAFGGHRFNGRVNGWSGTGKRVEIEVWIPDRTPLRSGHSHRTWVTPDRLEKQT